jgi:predicted transcriptional regulator
MTKLIELTGMIVSNYVEGNKLSSDELPSLIKTIYATLAGAEAPVAAEPEITSTKPTAAQIRKSLADPNVLVSFIDGKGYKTLKRHINGHGMTVDEYKERFGLPHDYPTTSRVYSAARSKMALDLGLGRSVAVKKPARKAK